MVYLDSLACSWPSVLHRYGGWQVANMWLTWQVWWLTCLVWWLTCLHPCLSLFMICMCHATGVSHSNPVLSHSTLTQVNVSHPWSALSALLHGWHGAHFLGGGKQKKIDYIHIKSVYTHSDTVHLWTYTMLWPIADLLTWVKVRRQACPEVNTNALGKLLTALFPRTYVKYSRSQRSFIASQTKH